MQADSVKVAGASVKLSLRMFHASLGKFSAHIIYTTFLCARSACFPAQVSLCKLYVRLSCANVFCVHFGLCNFSMQAFLRKLWCKYLRATSLRKFVKNNKTLQPTNRKAPRASRTSTGPISAEGRAECLFYIEHAFYSSTTLCCHIARAYTKLLYLISRGAIARCDLCATPRNISVLYLTCITSTQGKQIVQLSVTVQHMAVDQK